MMRQASGFTLVEVAISGALIGLCVLTAVALIPQGLLVQTENRLRAVSAASIVYLSAESFGRSSVTELMVNSGISAGGLKWERERAGLTSDPSGTLFQIDSPVNAGRLERRVVYTKNGTELTAWMLNKDPTESPTRATFLATYAEAPP